MVLLLNKNKKKIRREIKYGENMDINSLYGLVDRENINIIDTYLENTNGMYLNYNKIKAIVLDYKNFETSINEKCVLAEELGHYYMDATYPASTTYKDKELIDKQEYRAKKWSYYILVPFENLKEAIQSGITTIYELAEYFEVTIEYMKNCVNFYNSKYRKGKLLCLLNIL